VKLLIGALTNGEQNLVAHYCLSSTQQAYDE